MMNRFFCLLLCLVSFASFARAEEKFLITIKLVKNVGADADLPVKLEFPRNCRTCEIVQDPAYARQNSREVILAMRVPGSTPLDLKVQTNGPAFRRVTLETLDLPFQQTADGLKFTLPSQIADRVSSGEFQTHLYWPGVELRLEHGDPSRRAGDYASGEFPVVQREAATNLEFGLLEAIRRLGLDHYVDDQNLGRLFLMGFDTNEPHGHKDYPAHFHLALWLSTYRAYGSLIPHFYLTATGLIAKSVVTPYPWPIKPLEYDASESLTVTDTLTRPVYSLTITPEGWLNLIRSDGVQCALRPVKKGFDVGVRVDCQGFPSLTVQAHDDLAEGEIRETVDGKVVAQFRYDRDTGLLLQP